jgi:hypothetical protein
MAHDQLDYAAIRQRAEQRVKKRAKFFYHVAVYIAVNIFLWGLYFVLMPGVFPWPLMVMLGWGIGLVSHGVPVYLDTALDNMHEREYQKEIEREMVRRGLQDPAELYDKPKREQAMRLSDDGELIPVDDETESRQPSRRSRG